jgi:hypothetical protein
MPIYTPPWSLSVTGDTKLNQRGIMKRSFNIVCLLGGIQIRWTANATMPTDVGIGK